MILILEYLTTQGVIMRDLKPENFMVDMQGYLKLIDLVAAKVVKGRNIMSAKTFTLIGTPHYMAPEIIIGKGYTFTVSLYSLGINMFEFMCGSVPFGEKSEDPLEIYEEILNLELKYPRSLKDKKARKLMEQLLNKNEPEGRLGGPTFMSLKNNPWFEGINW
jgi:cGMP-dependent protein kinase